MGPDQNFDDLNPKIDQKSTKQKNQKNTNSFFSPWGALGPPWEPRGALWDPHGGPDGVPRGPLGLLGPMGLWGPGASGYPGPSLALLAYEYEPPPD